MENPCKSNQYFNTTCVSHVTRFAVKIFGFLRQVNIVYFSRQSKGFYFFFSKGSKFQYFVYCCFITAKPPAPSRVQLVRASTTTLEVCWGSVATGIMPN